MTAKYDALFDELCRELGFCSLGINGEEKVKALGASPAEGIARAVFAEEGLDYDTYTPDRVKVEVVACIRRHLSPEDRT